jgi:O-antigen/teichoic acid export membrane protein
MMRIPIVLRAVTTSWLVVFANGAVGFLLTPFVLHRLGDEAFGLWVLVVTVAGYYGLFDLGVGSAVLRYVSHRRALGEKDGVNEVVATAFYFYACACLVVIALAFVVTPWLPRFFSIRHDLIDSFRSLFLLAGVTQALIFPLLVFQASLQGAARFDQVYMLRIASLALRVIAVIAVLNAGGGLYGVGAAVILPNLLFYVAHVPLAFRANPGMSVHPKWMRKSVFRDMFRYGSASFAIGIGQQFRGNIYPVIIAKFMTPVAVTLFSLPSKLLAVPMEGIGTMTEIVNPLSSELSAHNDFATLRKLILLSIQSAFLILAPLATLLFVFGKELLTFWAGPQYASAYPLLVLLTIGLGTASTQCCVQSMLFGIARHTELIWYRVGEGLSIAVIGTIFLRVWGLPGLALVTAVTLLLTSLVLIPRHLCRILELPLRQYLNEGCLRPCIPAVPFAATLLAARFLVVIDTWFALIMALLLGGLTYLLTLSLLMFRNSPPSWLSLGVLEVVRERFGGIARFRSRAQLEKIPAGEF